MFVDGGVVGTREMVSGTFFWLGTFLGWVYEDLGSGRTRMRKALTEAAPGVCGLPGTANFSDFGMSFGIAQGMSDVYRIRLCEAGDLSVGH